MTATDMLQLFPTPTTNPELKAEKTVLSTVFAQRDGCYINELMLFVVHFNTIPNFINEIDINCTKACEWFADNYKNDIKTLYYDKIYYRQRKKAQYDDVFFFIYEDLIVDFDTNQSIVRFLFRQTPREKVDEVIKQILKFKHKRTSRNPEVSLLVNSVRGNDTKALKIGRTKLSIADNYNDDFLEIHRLILKRLSKPNDKGLVLLHGKPGTGKTSYIRYLISRVRKNVIFLPPSMAGAITNPELISILIDNPNSIFVIEDAENIVVDREQDWHSSVSALLNISDGLLSDCLNIQLICSFNTDLSKVDKALMRKGRMIAKYELTPYSTRTRPTWQILQRLPCAVFKINSCKRIKHIVLFLKVCHAVFIALYYKPIINAGSATGQLLLGQIYRYTRHMFRRHRQVAPFQRDMETNNALY